MKKNKTRLNSWGFSHVEMFIVLLVIVVVGAVGFMVYKHDRNSTAHAGSWSQLGSIQIGGGVYNVQACIQPVTLSEDEVKGIVVQSQDPTEMASGTASIAIYDNQGDTNSSSQWTSDSANVSITSIPNSTDQIRFSVSGAIIPGSGGGPVQSVLQTAYDNYVNLNTINLCPGSQALTPTVNDARIVTSNSTGTALDLIDPVSGDTVTINTNTSNEGGPGLISAFWGNNQSLIYYVKLLEDDGTYITTSLYSIKPDGSDDQLVTNCKTSCGIITYVQSQSEFIYGNDNGVYSMNSTGGDVNKIASLPSGNSFAGMWVSPDGTKLVYAYSSKAGGEFFKYELLNIASGATSSLPYSCFYDNISNTSSNIWTPNSNDILCSQDVGDGFSISSLPSTSNKITTFPDNLQAFNLMALSPNGKYIAFTADNNYLYVYTIASGSLTKLVSAPLYSGGSPLELVWSPNSSSLALYAKTPDGAGLNVINIDGSGLNLLQPSSQVSSSFSWSF